MDIEKLNCMLDLHLHLDGAISLKNAKNLAKIQNVGIPESDEEILDLLRVDDDCRSLNEFLERFAFPCSLLQTPVGIKTALETLCLELSEQGLMYAEIRFAPQKSTDNGMSIEDAVAAAIEGIENSPFPAQLILCAMREESNAEENLETVRVAKKYLGKGVCAIDLAGAEALFPVENFAYLFECAKTLGVPFTIHAGEAAGSQSVKNALDFGACRIGHGVRATEDKALIKRLAEEQIPLELCPSSNICTCIYEDISEYPIRYLLKNGICCTLNTDDMSIENTTIKREYKLLCKTFDLSRDEVKALLLNSVKASFAAAELKRDMTEMISAEFGDIEENTFEKYPENNSGK